MSQLTDRQNEIINMSPRKFGLDLEDMTESDYKQFVELSRSISTDKRSNGGSNTDLINLISREQGKSTFRLKLMQLAHTFYDQRFFNELVEAGIAKETIAYHFNTTVDNVQCQIMLNDRMKAFEKVTATQIVK